MTLIVARAAGSELRIVGDTRITDRGAIVRGAFVGALRLVTIGPDFAFCFSGDSGRGQQCLQKVAALYKAEAPWDALVERARAVHVDGRGDTQFLLGRIHDGVVELARIADLEVRTGLTEAWIGDPAVHEAYRAAVKRAGGADTTSTPAMLRAFRLILNAGPDHPVDPPGVAIVTLPGGLGWAPTGVLQPDARRGGSGVWTPPGGAFGYSIWAPVAPGVGAIGIWFEPGRLGALFFPERRAEPIVYKNVSVDDFRRALKLDFGLETEEMRFE